MRASKRWWRALVPVASMLSLGVVLTSCGGSPSLAGTSSTVTYCTNGGVDLAVQIYHPTDVPKNPVPVVVYFHGGGWQQGVPFIGAGTHFGDVETSIVNHGWYFATVQYRLAPRSSTPSAPSGISEHRLASSTSTRRASGSSATAQVASWPP